MHIFGTKFVSVLFKSLTWHDERETRWVELTFILYAWSQNNSGKMVHKQGEDGQRNQLKMASGVFP